MRQPVYAHTQPLKLVWAILPIALVGVGIALFAEKGATAWPGVAVLLAVSAGALLMLGHFTIEVGEGRVEWRFGVLGWPRWQLGLDEIVGVELTTSTALEGWGIRRTKTGNKMGVFGLSDPTGHYEAVIFSEGLAEYRELLEPGTAVLLVLSAEVQGDDVRARIQSAEPLDAAAANLQKGLRVFLRDGAPIEGVAKRLEASQTGPGRSAQGSAEGEVSMVLMIGQGTEVEVRLPGRFKVSPQIAGAIKAVPGVVQVEAL